MSSVDPDTAVMLTVPEACAVMRTSRTVLYPVITSGELPSVKVGRRRLIRRTDLMAYIAGLPADPSPSSAYRRPRPADEQADTAQVA